MKRRNFVKAGILTSVASTISGNLLAWESPTLNYPSHQFNLQYAPHFGMFKHHAGEDFIDQLKFISEVGFTAFEDNGMKERDKDTQEKIASQMVNTNMQMGVFVAHKIYWQEPNLTNGDKSKRDEFLKDIEDSVEVAKRVNATWMTVVPGHIDLRRDMGYQTASVVESLRRACELLEPHGLKIVLEPLNFRDHPGLFLKKIPQAYEICRAVDSPSCKILFDIYHQQITEGNIIPNIDLAWDEIAYFQIGDNPGRKEPTTGEINYKKVFEHIYNKGFRGVMGMEHGNSVSGKEGEQVVIDAYKDVDSFK